MESDRILIASYNYLCELCQQNQNCTEITIDYHKLDTETSGILREKIRVYFLYIHEKGIMSREICEKCYDGKAPDYIRSIMTDNTTYSLHIDYDKLKGCVGCYCEVMRGLRNVIQDVIINRRKILYSQFSRAR